MLPPTEPRPVRADVLPDADWLERLGPRASLAPGEVSGKTIRVPAAEAERTLRETIRLVADIPADSTPRLVWVQGADELLVHTDDVRLACDTGLVTISFRVACDQLGRDARVAVPLGVGTAKRPTGLVMSALTRPDGPPIVVDAWAQAIVAFAWEALVHLAQTVSAAVGSDAAGLRLVPATIGAEPRLLLVQPAARHTFARRES